MSHAIMSTASHYVSCFLFFCFLFVGHQNQTATSSQDGRGRRRRRSTVKVKVKKGLLGDQVNFGVYVYLLACFLQYGVDVCAV